MLHANGIVPRNPEPQGNILDTPPTSETSLGTGLGEQSKMKREAESGPETDDSDSDEDSLREKALMVSFFRFHVVNY